MKRRQFSGAGLGLGVAMPLWAQAPRRPWRVGRLAFGRPERRAPLLLAQDEGLRDAGIVEGENVEFVWRWAHGAVDAMPALAAELVAEGVDVIWTGNNTVTAAALRATQTIPIVMTLGVDPVRNGFVDSLARPGRNVTGTTADVGQEMHGKQLGLLKAMVPGLRQVGVLIQHGLGVDRGAIEAAARALSLRVDFADEVHVPQDIEPVLTAMRKRGSDAYLAPGGAVIYIHRQLVADTALKLQLPGVHWSADYVHAGALLSYGIHLADIHRRSASYVARILRGAKPGELPVEQPTRFEVALNVKTARALGLGVPPAVRLQAEQVIE